MLVDVKDAPDFVVGRTATTSFLSLLPIFSSHRTLNKRHRSAVPLVDIDDDFVAVATPPELEISILGTSSLYEYE